MLDYLSKKQRKLKVGITSYSENLTSLEVTGKVGIGISEAVTDLDVSSSIGSKIYAWNNVIDYDIKISPPYRTSIIYVDRELTVDIEPNAIVTIDDGCYLNIIDV